MYKMMHAQKINEYFMYLCKIYSYISFYTNTKISG